MSDVDGRAVLRSLWEHHWWSVGRLLEEARRLSAEEFGRELPISYGSFHGALAHLVGSELVWLGRVERGESAARVPGAPELPTLDEMAREWQRARLGWQRVFDADDLARVIVYTNTRGESFQDPVWLVLTHLVDHGAAYRGTLIAALRLLGRTPPVTGLIFYTRQKGNF